jgi:hypothetical protein
MSCPPVHSAPADWDARLTSTFPDTLTQAANKTALTALGCYDITKVGLSGWAAVLCTPLLVMSVRSENEGCRHPALSP